MPEFQYIARELSGQQVTGVVTAGSEQEALGSLSARQLFPVRIDLAEEAIAQQKQIARRVPPRQLSVFYTQLADLLRSGVPLLRSLELLERKTVQPGMRGVIEDVREQVAEGSRLADAMRRHPKIFSQLALSMIHAGEEGSFLEDVLKRIAAFTDHQEALKSRVVGAMVYPMFLLGMGTLIVAGMLIFFVPKFAPIFERMSERGQLPTPTLILMGASDWLQSYGWLLAILIGGGGYMAWQWLQTAEGRHRFDRFRISMLKIGPIQIGFGDIVRSLAIARFCRILGTLLRNGVPILQSLRIAKDASGNQVLSTAIGEAADSVSTGKSLAGPLSVSGEFPEEVVEMISVGEEANNLEQVLIDIADNMERLTNRRLEMFVRMLEPVMLTLMAGIILFVVIALLLPILQSSGIL